MKLPNLIAGVAATPGIMAPKRIYIIGGMDGGIDSLNLTQIYNPENDSWTLGAQKLTARMDLTISVVNDQLYVFGGSAYAMFSPALTTNEEYTPSGYGSPDSSPTSIVPEFPLSAILPLLFILISAAVIVELRTMSPGRARGSHFAMLN
jgi:hypothetical protein